MSKKQLAEALLKVCHAHGYDPGDDEDGMDYLGRMLPVIAGELRPGKKLTPLEVSFFQMTDKALRLLYEDLGLEGSDFDEDLEEKPREQIARELARRSTNKEAIPHINERMFASQITVHQYNIDHPPFPKEARAALKRTLGRDIFDGEGPKEGIGSEFVPIAGTVVAGHVYAITLAHTVIADEHVNSRFLAEDILRLQMVHIIIDPDHKSGEFRGPVSQRTAATRALLKALEDGGHKSEASSIIFDADDAEALVAALDARGRKIVIKNDSGPQSGTGRKTLEGDARYQDPVTGRHDYFKSGDYKKEIDGLGEDEHIWDMGLALDYDNKTYPIDVNLASSSLRFPDASTTDSVIRFVTRELTKIRRARDKADKAKKKEEKKDGK